MLPHHHAITSLAISLIYSLGYLFFLNNTIFSLQILIVVFATTLIGFLVDVDHVFWALALSHKLAGKYLLSNDLKGIYREFVNPSGFFHKKISSNNRSSLFFQFHGVWIGSLCLLIYLVSPLLPLLEEHLYLFWAVLITHYISDLIYWRAYIFS